MLFWQRKKNIRDEILYGVYLENLRIFGYLPAYTEPGLAARYGHLAAVALVAVPALLLGNSVGHDDHTPAAPLPAPHEVVNHPPLVLRPPEAVPLPMDPDSQAEWFGLSTGLVMEELPTLRKLFGLTVRKIVIDPGHGGVDPGTSGRGGLQEKEITLDIALRLKEKLEQHGRYEVVLTRAEDKTLSLKERVELANRERADLFISIHVNYLPSRPNNLIETYYFGVSPDEHSVDLAQRENAGSEVAIHEFARITEQMGNTLKWQESKRLASEIQRSLYSNLGDNNQQQVLDMGIRKAPFVVIMGTEMPAVLAEVTSLSNAEEEKKLQEADYRQALASYLESGIVRYINKGDYVYVKR